MKLVHLVGFVIKKPVMMRGHMDIKNVLGLFIVILDMSSSDMIDLHFRIVAVKTEAFILWWDKFSCSLLL